MAKLEAALTIQQKKPPQRFRAKSSTIYLAVKS
jgi:hypothetical protein